MTESQRKQVAAIRKVISLLKKSYGKPCPDHHWGCAVCDAYRVISYLETQISLIKYA